MFVCLVVRDVSLSLALFYYGEGVAIYSCPSGGITNSAEVEFRGPSALYYSSQAFVGFLVAWLRIERFLGGSHSVREAVASRLCQLA